MSSLNDTSNDENLEKLALVFARYADLVFTKNANEDYHAELKQMIKDENNGSRTKFKISNKETFRELSYKFNESIEEYIDFYQKLRSYFDRNEPEGEIYNAELDSHSLFGYEVIYETLHDISTQAAKELIEKGAIIIKKKSNKRKQET